MGLFDEIVAKLDETDRGVITKYPQIADAIKLAETSQAELSQLKPKFEKVSGDYQTYVNWYSEHWDPAMNMTKSEVQARSELDRSNARLTQLEGLVQGGDDVTFAEIEQQLTEKGYVKKETVDALVAAKVDGLLRADPTDPRKAGPILQEINSRNAMLENFYFDTAPLLTRHFRDYGQDLDLRGLAKFAAEKSMLADPGRAYDEFTRTQRDAKAAEAQKAQQAEIDAKIAAAKAEGLKEGEQKALAGQSPTDTGGSHPGSWLPNRVTSTVEKPPVPEGTKPGDPAMGVLAAEYFKKRAAAQQNAA